MFHPSLFSSQVVVLKYLLFQSSLLLKIIFSETGSYLEHYWGSIIYWVANQSEEGTTGISLHCRRENKRDFSFTWFAFNQNNNIASHLKYNWTEWSSLKQNERQELLFRWSWETFTIVLLYQSRYSCFTEIRRQVVLSIKKDPPSPTSFWWSSLCHSRCFWYTKI